MFEINISFNNKYHSITEILLVRHKSFLLWPQLRYLWCSSEAFTCCMWCGCDFWLLTQAHIKHLIKSSHLHLQTFICPSLCFKDAEIVIHAFMVSQLDYCNSLLTLLLIKLLSRSFFWTLQPITHLLYKISKLICLHTMLFKCLWSLILSSVVSVFVTYPFVFVLVVSVFFFCS